MAGPPPPPYQSVIDDGDQNHFFSPAIPTQSHDLLAQQQTKDSEVQVTDPVKQGDGVSAYVSYKVKSQRYSRDAPAVVRRFRDFAWLHDKLCEKNKGIIVPALPEKSAVQKFQMATDFIEQRRRALQVFINRVAAHPVLRESKELQIFLTANEEDWTLEMARWQAETSAQKQPVQGAMNWFKSLTHATQNLVSGRSDDAMEDTEYIKVRDYINALEGHLAEAHRQAGRLVRKELELGQSLAEFGLAAEQLGKLDEAGSMRQAFDLLNSKASHIATLSRHRCEQLSNDFEAPLKEFARTIKSVQAAMADRAAALSALAQAKADLDSKKVRLAKMRGTPTIKEEKLAEAERELREAEDKVSSSKITYETVVARMTEELNRFQKERSAEMTAVLKQFALAQAQYAADNAKAWTTFLTDLQRLPPGPVA